MAKEKPALERARLAIVRFPIAVVSFERGEQRRRSRYLAVIGYGFGLSTPYQFAASATDLLRFIVREHLNWVEDHVTLAASPCFSIESRLRRDTLVVLPKGLLRRPKRPDWNIRRHFTFDWFDSE